MCYAFGKECFRCSGKDHFKGAENCKGKGKQENTRRVSEKKKNRESSGSSSNEDDEEFEVKRVRAHAARFVGHVRRTVRRSKGKKKKPRYQVPVIIKGKEVMMFADTGADVCVMSKSMSDKLELTLMRTRMKIKPYGAKAGIRCVGYYVGPVMYGNVVANIGIYVVKKKVESLLSGAASEALGIISFSGQQEEIRRSVASEDPLKEELMETYPKVFTGVGKLRDYKVTLHVDESVPPVACPPYPVPYHLQAQLDKEIERMEKAGIIEDHKGPAPWVNNIVLSPNDSTVCVTVDMREPNKAIVNTRIPIPRPEDIRKELSGCKWFTKLDFKTAFHQLELAEESRYLTVFHHKSKLKRHTRLTMGAMPASGELNKALRPLFSKVKGAHIIHDDLVLATVTKEEQKEAIHQVLQIAERENLTLNPDKCKFMKKEIPFWGMIISAEGVRPDPAKIQALQEASPPRNKAEVMSFLCMVQANGEFIPKLSQKTVNLRKLTEKDVPFKWTKQYQDEFQRVKGLLCETSLLGYFDVDSPTFLIVDAHKTGISAILAQGTTLEKAKMVCCASRTTTPIERNYPQLDLEALSVDFALRRFRPYIVGGPQVTVVTDHKPLVSIFKNTRRGSVRTDRIKLRHQDVNYKVVWQKGVMNMADYMSRHATEWERLPKTWKEETKELEKTVWMLNLSPYTEAISFQKIIEETEKDKRLQQLKRYLQKGYMPKNMPK